MPRNRTHSVPAAITTGSSLYFAMLIYAIRRSRNFPPSVRPSGAPIREMAMFRHLTSQVHMPQSPGRLRVSFTTGVTATNAEIESPDGALPCSESWCLPFYLSALLYRLRTPSRISNSLQCRFTPHSVAKLAFKDRSMLRQLAARSYCKRLRLLKFGARSFHGLMPASVT
jgi:hypothetical protein